MKRFDEAMQMTEAPRLMQVVRLALILVCCPGVLHAQLDSGAKVVQPLALDEAVQMALENNYAIRIERFNPLIAGYDLKGSYSLYEPSLDFSATHSFNRSPGGLIPGTPESFPPSESETDRFAAELGGVLPFTGLGYSIGGDVTHRESERGANSSEEYFSGATIRLTQPLLRDFWIDAPRAQIAINKRSLKISESAFKDQVMQSIADVEQAYYNLIFTIENVRVQEKALELANRLLEENRKRVEVGTMAPLDQQLAQSRVASARATVIDARRALSVQQNQLKRLIHEDFAAASPVFYEPTEKLIPVPPSFDLQESWEEGMAKRPDLEQAKLDLERRNITLKFQKNQLFPALDLVGSYGHNGLDTSYERVLEDLGRSDNPRYSYGVVLSIPLGNISARNRYRASKAEIKQALLRLKALEQTVLVEIDNAVKLAQANYERLDATRAAREFQEAALEAEEKKLASGKSTSFLVLEFQRDLTEARFNEIRALAEYNTALSQLARAKGTTLERRGIDVTVEGEAD